MQVFLIILMVIALGVVVYYLFFSSLSKKGLEPVNGSPNHGVHQELAMLKDTSNKAELNYSLLQKELETERKAKTTLEEEHSSLKAAFDKMKSDYDLYKIENASLKGKLMERDRDNRKMADELKVVREKNQQGTAPKPVINTQVVKEARTVASEPVINTQVVKDTHTVANDVKTPAPEIDLNKKVAEKPLKTDPEINKKVLDEKAGAMPVQAQTAGGAGAKSDQADAKSNPLPAPAKDLDKKTETTQTKDMPAKIVTEQTQAPLNISSTADPKPVIKEKAVDSTDNKKTQDKTISASNAKESDKEKTAASADTEKLPSLKSDKKSAIIDSPVKFKLVEEDGDDDKTKKNKDLQNPE